MSQENAKIDGEAEGGPLLPSSKVPGRVDKLVEAVLECSRALALIAKSLDEGALRTACLAAATRSEAYAKASVYNPAFGGRRRRRPNRDDKRTMAIQARNGDQDEDRSSGNSSKAKRKVSNGE